MCSKRSLVAEGVYCMVVVDSQGGLCKSLLTDMPFL